MLWIKKSGWTQTYKKDKRRRCWTQKCPNGKVRRMTAEQLLSHILPPMAAGRKSRVKIVVKKK